MANTTPNQCSYNSKNIEFFLALPRYFVIPMGRWKLWTGTTGYWNSLWQRSNSRQLPTHLRPSGIEQRRILEALSSLAHDPQIGVGVIDHGSHHPPEAEIETHLHDHQHNGKDDPDRGCTEAKSVMKQVASGERQIEQRMAIILRARGLTGGAAKSRA